MTRNHNNPARDAEHWLNTHDPKPPTLPEVYCDRCGRPADKGDLIRWMKTMHVCPECFDELQIELYSRD